MRQPPPAMEYFNGLLAIATFLLKEGRDAILTQEVCAC